jgi:hypothetical protein
MTIAPFDLTRWIEEHGGVHLQKACDFEIQGFKVVSHVCFDERGGFYHTLNVYHYPDGRVSLGQNSKGGNKYPLKGKRLVLFDDSNQKHVLVGRKSMAEVISHFQSRGYSRMETAKEAPKGEITCRRCSELEDKVRQLEAKIQSFEKKRKRK